MNIFILSKDPKKCAQYHCNTHVVKMILEHAQMLSTVYRLTYGKLIKVAVRREKGIELKDWYSLDTDSFDKRPTLIHGDFYPVLESYEVYSPTHINHPCTQWVMKSKANYDWLVKMTSYLNKEYKYRFDHKENHKSWDMIEDYLLEADELPDFSLTKPALAMGDEYKISSGFNIKQTKSIIKQKEPILLVIKSYRNYYAKAKAHLLTYTKRERPEWLDEY